MDQNRRQESSQWSPIVKNVAERNGSGAVVPDGKADPTDGLLSDAAFGEFINFSVMGTAPWKSDVPFTDSWRQGCGLAMSLQSCTKAQKGRP